MAEASRKPIIEAHAVSKYFGTVIALQEASLAVHAGENLRDRVAPNVIAF